MKSKVSEKEMKFIRGMICLKKMEDIREWDVGS